MVYIAIVHMVMIHLQDQHPTESIPITDMNVTMNGQTGHPNAMQITAIIRGKTRNYFVYAENGKVKTVQIIVAPPVELSLNGG